MILSILNFLSVSPFDGHFKYSAVNKTTELQELQANLNISTNFFRMTAQRHVVQQPRWILVYEAARLLILGLMISTDVQRLITLLRTKGRREDDMPLPEATGQLLPIT